MACCQAGNGLTFHYEGKAIEADQFPRLSEASCARVFVDPSPKREGYVMLFMGNQQGRRKIFLARSPDARQWVPVPEPLFAAPDAKTPQTSAPWLWNWRGTWHVLAHAPYSDRPYAIYAMETDPELSTFRYAGPVFRALAGEPDHGRVAAPCLIEEDGTLYLFYENGPRLHCKTSLATAPAR